jgi:hypothetical protein
MQRFFQITPPRVYAMVITLARHGLIRRVGLGGRATSTVPVESLLSCNASNVNFYKPCLTKHRSEPRSQLSPKA